MVSAVSATLWSTNSANSGATRMVMEADGSLNLYDSNGNYVWSSAWYSISVPGSKAIITDDGEFGVITGTLWIWNRLMVSCANLLQLGQSLRIGDSRTSCNGHYKVLMRSDGNLVVKSSPGTDLWSSGTPGAVRATMEADGSLVIYGSSGNILWSTEQFSMPVAGSSAIMNDDGHFYVFSGTTIIWDSGV